MKYFLSLILWAAVIFTKAQIKLDQKDLNNLIAIAELYSYNTDARGAQFAKSIDSLRTPKLNPIVDALIAVGKGDKDKKRMQEIYSILFYTNQNILSSRNQKMNYSHSMTNLSNRLS